MKRPIAVISVVLAALWALPATPVQAAPGQAAASRPDGAPPAPVPPDDRYVPVTPFRLLDTRPTGITGDGLEQGAGPVGAGGVVDVTVAGRDGIPATGVEAVVLHLTAVNATAKSWVTAFPTGTPHPGTSTVNFTAGLTASNLTLVRLGTGGAVSLYNNAGSVNLIADVVGWLPATAPFTGVDPARLLDTRITGTHLGPGETIDLAVTGVGGVPANGVTSVALNVTVVGATASTWLSVRPKGTALPPTSNLNAKPGQVAANAAIAEVGADGKISISNANGTVDVIVDVTGWFGTGPGFQPVTPARVVDTRGGTPLSAGGTIDVTLRGVAGVPPAGVGAVVFNLTAVNQTQKTYLTVYPKGATRPATSDLNPQPGLIAPNLVIGQLGADGAITVYNATGSVDVLVDVVGWMPSHVLAVSDAATVTEDSAATAIPVLASDTEFDGGPLLLQSVTQPAHGTVVITGGGTGLTYAPDANYCNDGSPFDSFGYTLYGLASATVNVTVTCVDDLPVAVADDATVSEDAGPTGVAVLANDTDVDGGPKSIASVTQPANGTVVITGGGTGLTYAPSANYCNTPAGAADTFTYTLNGGSTTTVSMTVTCVDDPPVAVNDSATVTEGDPATAVDVLANDTDVDGGPKSIASVTQPANGTVVITGGGTGLTYAPSANYCNDGSPLDTFTYTLNGGSTATVSMTVTCVDTPPTAVDDAATVSEDAGATAVAVLSNDTDVDGGPKSIASVTQPGNGTVVITGGGTGLTYAPNANYCNDGSPLDTFTYTLTPGGSSATVSMTVTCVDDAPVAVNDVATVTEDSSATAVGVLANDTDVDGGPRSIASVTQPANGTVVITGGGTGLTYAPDANYCNDGSPLDTFTYTLNGGSTATVSMTVTCVDDAPGAANDAATVSEDAGATAVAVLSNDTDVDGGPKSIASVTQPGNGTVVITGGGTGLTYAPDANYCNTPPGTTLDTFTYTLNGGSTATVSMTVTCVDDAPTAVNDPATVTEDAGATAVAVLSNDTDVDGGPKSIASVTQPGNGTVVITGGGTGLTYAPNADYCNDTSPLDTFTYTLTPGGSSATVSMTVTCVNDAPAAVTHTYGAQANMTVSIGAGSGLLAGVTDPDGVTTLTIGTVSATSPAGGAITNLDTATGAFDFTPPPGVTGAVTFTYTVCDDGIPGPGVCSPATTVTVNVAGPVIWFVDDSAAPAGDGTLAKPFQTVAQASAAIGSSTGQRVFVFGGSYADGLTMKDSGWLVGQEVTGASFDAVFGITPPAGVQSRPAIATGTVTLGGEVKLANSATVRGVRLSTAGKSLSGSALTGVDVAQVRVLASGQALDLNNVAGTVTIDNLAQTGGTTGVSVVGSTAAVTITAGSITSTTGKAVTLDGSSGAFTMGASISVSSGTAVEVKNRTGTSNPTFTASVSASGGSGVVLTTNSSTTTVTFSGVVSLSTGSSGAFTATNAGQVEVTNSASTLATTTGTALNVSGTTITANGLTFTSISSNGAASGIVLSNTGSAGGLSVLGSGSADTGGTIQNTTAAGVSLTNTAKVSFNWLRIDGTSGSGINGTGVVDFSFTNGTINNSGTGGGADTSNIAFNTSAAGNENNLSGTVTVSNSTLTNALWHGIDILDYSGTIGNLTLSGNTITSSISTTTSRGTGIRVQALGSGGAAAAVTKAAIANNTISNFPSGGGILAQGGNPNQLGPGATFGTAGVGNAISITGNKVAGQSIVAPMNTSAIMAILHGVGTGVFDVSNNGTVAQPLTNTAGTTILFGNNGAGTATFTINNNVIVANNTVGSQGIGGGNGVVWGSGNSPTTTATVTNNTISNTDGNGILAVARAGAGTLNVKIQNNTVGAPLGGVRPGIRVDSGNSVTAADTVCLNISGNTSGGTQGIGLRRQTGSPAVFGVNGMAATGTPGVETYVNGLNPAGNGTLLISATTGFSNCALP